MESAIQNYLENRDSQLLLVGISQSIDADQCDTVSSTLLQYEEIVKTLGWDILTLLTPYLPPLPSIVLSSSTWRLITTITEICPAKEMCLALLEQLETLSSSSPPLFFIFLDPLLSILKRIGVGDGRKHVSTLRSVRSMLTRVYPNVSEEEEFTTIVAAGHVVGLVEPFTTYIHQQFISHKAPLQTYWSPLQKETVGLLLTLLGPPLVTSDLNYNSENMNTVQAIMRHVVHCHCGFLQLLETTDTEGMVHRGLSDDDEEESYPLSSVGVACFIYLVLVVGIERDYFPSPLNPYHLFYTSLLHCLSLTNLSEKHSILKGLELLENVLNGVETHSLTLVCHSSHYINIAQMLVDVMVTCPHKRLRQRSLCLLPLLIQSFSSSIRHMLYRCLLDRCTHSGVQGLLIQYIKNEVDSALQSQGDEMVENHFLSGNLHPLLNQIFSFCSSDSELLRETDRVMGGLNFLRYLIIRDPPSSNTTGIWTIVEHVRSKFVEPIRLSLDRSRLQLRTDTQQQSLQEEEEEEEEVKLEISGVEVSNPKQQAKILQLASYQLDMMECVLVRVEELLDQSL